MHDDGTIFPPRPPGDEAPTLDRGPGRPLSQAETDLHGPAEASPPEQPAGPDASPRRFGDFLIEKEIARGGMGVVYRARQLSLGRLVALKMILSTQIHPTHAKRFHMEAEAAGRLNHPNIVQVFGVGELEGRHYFSMALVEGWSLDDRLRAGPVPPADAARWIEAAARGVHFAHSRNIVHRDIKPANILIDVDGTPKITDFGIAKRLDDDSEMTRAGQVMGTPGYMSPEQAAGKSAEVGPPADVYALGATLYALLARRPPFRGEPAEVIRQVLQEEPEPPSRVNKAVDSDLEAVCLKCLEKEPSRRYASAAELADDLGRWRRGEPTLARPATPTEAFRKWVRREPWRAGAWAALIALGLLIITVGCVYYYKETEQGRLMAEKAKELAESKGELEKANEGLEKALADVKAKEREARSAAADAVLRQAHSLCEAGQPQVALLLCGEAEGMAPPEDAPLRALAGMQRSVIAAALPRPLRLYIPHEGFGPVEWAVRAGGRVFVVTDKLDSFPHAFHVFNGVTGQASGPCITGVPLRKTNKGTGKSTSFHDPIHRAEAGGDTWLLAAGKRGVQRFDPGSGKPLGKAVIGNVAIPSPDGGRAYFPAALGDGIHGELREVPSGKVVVRVPVSPRTPPGHPAFSADGKTLLTLDAAPDARPGAYVLRRWDAASGDALPSWPLPPGIDYPRAGTDRRIWLAGPHAVLKVPHPDADRRHSFLTLDGVTGKPLGRAWGAFGRLTAAAISPDGRWLALASTTREYIGRPLGSDAKTRVHMLYLPDGSPVCPAWDIHASVPSLTFSPDGGRLLAAAGSAAVEYDLTPLRTADLPPLDGPPILLASPPGGGVVAATTSAVRRWGADGKPTPLNVAVPASPWRGGSPPLAALSPDGHTLALADGRRVRLLDAVGGKDTGRVLAHPDGDAGGKGTVVEVRFSGDGRSLLSRVATHPDPLRPHRAFPPGGREMDPDQHAAVRVWDLASGETALGPLTLDKGEGVLAVTGDGKGLLRRLAVLTHPDAHPSAPPATSRLVLGGAGGDDAGVIGRAAFSPDGRHLFTVERAAGAGRMRDAATLAPLGQALDGPLSAFAFSPDGRVLATASGREARLWWVETRRPLGPSLYSPSDIVALCFGHDGKTLLSAGADRVIRSRRLPDVDPARLEALTGMRLQAGGLTALTAPEWAALLDKQAP